MPRKVDQTPIDPEKQFQLEMEKLEDRREQRKQDKQLNIAMREVANLRKQMESLTAIKDQISTYKVQSKGKFTYEVTPVVVASDWHVAERVTKESVDGSNEYGMRIAKKRADAFFANTVKLIKKESQDAKIHTMVLALLGDFISGNIHEELLEICEVPPVEEAMYAQNILASGIEYLLNNTNLNIVIPCCVGNHSRITPKVHVATEPGNSLEWMIYTNLARHFENEKRIKFILSKSYFTYVEIYDFLIRFHHGHAIRYGGGIGGLTVPVIKAIARYDLDKKAYLDVFGHFHNRMDGNKFIVNGCLIGDTPYGKRLGFTGKPEQVFFLIQKGYGKTGVFPIFID